MKTIELPDPGILYVRAFIGLLLVVLYVYNLTQAYYDWHKGRDWDTFRSFFMAFELMFGVILIFTGYVNTAFFAQSSMMTDILRGASWVLIGVLLIGGVTLAVSWKKPER